MLTRLAGIIEAQRHQGLLWAPVALGTGIGIYFALKSEPGPLLVWALAALATALLSLAALRRNWPAALVGLAIAGIALSGLHTRLAQAPVLDGIYYGPVSGRVVGLDRSASNRVRVMLDRVHIPGRAEVPFRVRLVLAADPAATALTPGQRVMTTARLTPPPPPVEPAGFDFRRHAWFLRIGAIGYAPNPLMLETPPGRGEGAEIFGIRLALSERIRAAMPGHTGPFAAAILTGDRSAIDPGDLVALRASNLAHLLAISGLHMGLLTGVVFLGLRIGLALIPALALRVPVKKWAALAALGSGLAYLVISGASIATQRAFIMAAVILVAVLVDRAALTLRAVAVAALIVLILHPVSLLSAGFQMSFAATIGLIWCFEGLKRSDRWQAMGRGRWRVPRAVLVVGITSPCPPWG